MTWLTFWYVLIVVIQVQKPSNRENLSLFRMEEKVPVANGQEVHQKLLDGRIMNAFHHNYQTQKLFQFIQVMFFIAPQLSSRLAWGH